MADMIDQRRGKPLRILAIVNIPWDPRLGAARVWIELAEEWIKAGHRVDKFCLTDAFPVPASSRGLSALRLALFPYRAAAYVRRNPGRFDVIDCLIGTLPFSKQSLQFEGLLVARSVGLHRLYDRFDHVSRKRWPDQPKGRLFGGLFYKTRARHLRKSADKGITRCDLLNLPNENELQEIEENIRPHRPAMVQPYGLSDCQREACERAAGTAHARLAKKKICFVGMWSLRKGSRDWPKIIHSIWSQDPDAVFTFLGTMFGEDVVRRELGMERSERIHCIPTYDPFDLPGLLADSAVGLFPSYIEGFGLTVLEQLACGIPTIAYDVPGPRQILRSLRAVLLTPEGDARAMAGRALEILRMSASEYSALSVQCRAIAGGFRWERIATDTAQQYRAALEDLRAEPAPICTA